ncbi:hypothetical protein N7475_001421 [Penicillium sp. IBT 31633x]|nr:hypothetical protein N7475_001421 [Penicillium sp. IBT 31633x]
MSASPEASAPAPTKHVSSPTAPASPHLETGQKDQAANEKDDHKSTEELKKATSGPVADGVEEGELTSAPPLPDEIPPPLSEEIPPPLPEEAPPAQPEDDGWEPVWDANAQAYYFYNRFTGHSQWDNPRVPPIPAAPGTEDLNQQAAPQKEPVLGGYNPAIHGDYDPTADYAQIHEEQALPTGVAGLDPSAAYAATGTFNRFTGRWQAASINPDNHNDENKSRRQMNAFFDVDAAANSHDGRSLRAERSARKLTKQELKQFKEKRREKKEEKRRAWLRD